MGGRKKKEDLIKLLEEDDRGQRRITWWRGNMEEDNVSGSHISGVSGGGGEEEEGGETQPAPGMEEEDPEWVDILPGGKEASGSETVGRPSRRPKPGRTSPSKGVGRLQGGQGKRGFWMRRKEKLLGGTDVNRVKGIELGGEDERASSGQTTEPLQPKIQSDVEDRTKTS